MNITECVSVYGGVNTECKVAPVVYVEGMQCSS